MPILAAKVTAALAGSQSSQDDRQRRIERAIALSDRFSDIKPAEFTLPIGNLTLCSAKAELASPAR